MKKFYAIVLGLVLVLALGSVAMAAAETFSGKVEVTWGDDNTDDDLGAVFGGTREAAISFDYKKEFSDTVSAGLVGKITFDAGETLVYDADGDGEYDEGIDDKAATDEVKLDSQGWIKIKFDSFDVTAWTGVKGSVGNDIETGDNIPELAGVQVDVTAVEGLTLTGIVNNSNEDPDGDGNADETVYNFLVKGSYTMEALTIGGGFASDGAPEGTDATTAFDVFGSYTLEDLGLTIGVEYASRGADESGSAYLLKASFTGVEGLTVNGSYAAKDEKYGWTLDPTSDDVPDPQDMTVKDLYRMYSAEASLLKADATYAVTEALSVNGAVEYGSFPEFPSVGELTALYIKLGADYAVSDVLSVGGSYANFSTEIEAGDGEEANCITGTVTYTFAEGVEGSFELKSYSGDYENTSYTAKITATF